MDTEQLERELEIILDNPNGIFVGGQTINGKVQLQLLAEHKFRGIFIKINGRAYCHWGEGYGERKRYFTGKEIYIQSSVYLDGTKNGTKIYPPDVYTFPFEWHLPLQLPQSCEGKHGHIRYKLTAGINRPFFLDKTVERPFIVGKIMDLNQFSLLKTPVEVELNKNFNMCCLLNFCSSSNNLYMNATLNSGGFSPGENIDVVIQATNKSDKDVREFTVKLSKLITYLPYKSYDSKTKIDVENLNEQKIIGCRRNESQEYRICVPVPMGILPTDTTSNMVKIEYAVIVTGTVGIFHKNPELFMPLVIGTIPLEDWPNENAFTEIKDYENMFGVHDPPPQYEAENSKPY